MLFFQYYLKLDTYANVRSSVYPHRCLKCAIPFKLKCVLEIFKVGILRKGIDEQMRQEDWIKKFPPKYFPPKFFSPKYFPPKYFPPKYFPPKYFPPKVLINVLNYIVYFILVAVKSHRYLKKSRLLKFCCVPTTSTTFLAFFLLRPLTFQKRQTRKADHTIN